MDKTTKLGCNMNWKLEKEVNNDNIITKIYTHKKYKCPDGDSVELFYNNHTTFSTMEIYLFSGVESSHIFFDQLDVRIWCDEFGIEFDKENIEGVMLEIADRIVGLFYDKQHDKTEGNNELGVHKRNK